MLSKENWEQTKQKWIDYWQQKNTGRPLMHVVARNANTEDAWQKAKQEGKKGCEQICQGVDYLLPDELMYHDMVEKYQDAKKMVERYRHFCGNHTFLAESFPNINVDFGPGCMAAYQGAEVVFHDDTVWFEHFVKDWKDTAPIRFDENQKWWKAHYTLVQEVQKLAGSDFYVGIPDIMENVDVLSSMRGAQDIIYDMIDYADELHKRVEEVEQAYFEYYDRFYDVVRQDGGSCYTVFQIWGPGKTAKLQCDFSAMLSPDHFRQLILEPLRRQARKLDTVMYHLDGAECIRHMDALMEIDEIKALQWTSGDFGPDGTLQDWDVIYDKARAAGKSLWVKVYTGELQDWIRNVDRIVARYGSHSLFLHFPEMSMREAEILLAHAERQWKDIEGSFKG